MSEVKLGFTYKPVPLYIFVGGEEDKDTKVKCLWYSIDFKTGDPEPIPHEALCGTISSIRMVNKPYKGKDNVKVDISISADRKYVIRSGINTIFSRGILLALEFFGNIKSVPVTICVAPGDEENVIYGSVYNAQTNEPIRGDWDRDKKLSPIVNKIQEILGVEVQDIHKVLEEGRSK